MNESDAVFCQNCGEDLGEKSEDNPVVGGKTEDSSEKSKAKESVGTNLN